MKFIHVTAPLLAVLFLSGCSFFGGAHSKANLFPHHVSYPGENLGVIANWYTGKSSNWPRLAQVNPGLKPNRIRVGDTIWIPRELMKTTRKPSQEYLASFRRRERTSGTPVATAQSKVAEHTAASSDALNNDQDDLPPEVLSDPALQQDLKADEHQRKAKVRQVIDEVIGDGTER